MTKNGAHADPQYTMKGNGVLKHEQVLFEDFGMHTPVQINISIALNPFKGFKSMLCQIYIV